MPAHRLGSQLPPTECPQKPPRTDCLKRGESREERTIRILRGLVRDNGQWPKKRHTVQRHDTSHTLLRFRTLGALEHPEFPLAHGRQKHRLQHRIPPKWRQSPGIAERLTDLT